MCIFGGVSQKISSYLKNVSARLAETVPSNTSFRQRWDCMTKRHSPFAVAARAWPRAWRSELWRRSPRRGDAQRDRGRLGATGALLYVVKLDLIFGHNGTITPTGGESCIRPCASKG